MLSGIQHERLHQRGENFLCDYCGIVGVVEHRQHHREFIAPVARDRVALAQATAQTFGNPFQDNVTGSVTKRIVDDFEAVKVDEQYRCQLLGSSALGDRLLQAIIEQCPVGQAGQGIVSSQIFQLTFENVALAIVSCHHREKPGITDIACADREQQKKYFSGFAQSGEFLTREGNWLAARGNEAFDIARYEQVRERGTDQLFFTVTEYILRGRIQTLDAALFIESNDAFVCGIEHGTLSCRMQRNFPLARDQLAAHVFQGYRHIVYFVDVGGKHQALIDVAVGDTTRGIA